MGVQGLENYIKEYSNIFQMIDIRYEIEQWRREHGSNPIIIIDIKEVVKVFYNIDVGGLILGGRYQKWNDILDYFFREMKKSNADLVFFLRLKKGPWSRDRSLQILPVYDFIMRKNHLTNFLNEKNALELIPSDRVMYNLMNSICAKYGEVYIDYGLEKRVILAYAREHQERVMALITRNTEYLVYDGDFQYWCLSDVQFCELKIANFCRQKLNEQFDLSVAQWQLLLAVSMLERHVKDRLSGCQGVWDRLPRLAEYVKRQAYGLNGYESSKLTGDLTSDEQVLVGEKLDHLKLIESYDGKWNSKIYEGLILDLASHDESFNLVLKFCKENIYFAYKLMNETSFMPRDLIFIDVRRADARPFIDLVVDVTSKMCGIIFKDVDPDKQPKTRTVKIRRTFGEEVVETEVDIIYPTMPLPSLSDLIVEEEDKSFDESRWSLLEWLLDLSDESVLDINSSKKHLRTVLLTLIFLLSHGMITTRDADIILLTESDGRSKGNVYVPRNCPPPPMPDKRFPRYVDIEWVQTAHKYTISFELVCHCLELCGFRKQTDLIEMDACKFHDNMNLIENGNDAERIERMMAQIEDIRLW